MTLETTTGKTHTVNDAGPTVQTTLDINALGLNSPITHGANINSNKILSGGYKSFAFGIKSTTAGSVSIQRYLDPGATIPQGSPVTGSLVANTALTVNSNDGAPFQSMIINVSNSDGAATATLSNVLLLFQSQ